MVLFNIGTERSDLVLAEIVTLVAVLLSCYDIVTIVVVVFLTHFSQSYIQPNTYVCMCVSRYDVSKSLRNGMSIGIASYVEPLYSLCFKE